MYCVYCGVKLQDGAKECPLCRTPVAIAPAPGTEEKALYSDRCINSCNTSWARFCKSVYATDPNSGAPHKVQAGKTVSNDSLLSGRSNSSIIHFRFSSGLFETTSCCTI